MRRAVDISSSRQAFAMRIEILGISGVTIEAVYENHPDARMLSRRNQKQFRQPGFHKDIRTRRRPGFILANAAVRHVRVQLVAQN